MTDSRAVRSGDGGGGEALLHQRPTHTDAARMAPLLVPVALKPRQTPAGPGGRAGGWEGGGGGGRGGQAGRAGGRGGRGGKGGDSAAERAHSGEGGSSAARSRHYGRERQHNAAPPSIPLPFPPEL